jgi:hypothetical protein
MVKMMRIKDDIWVNPNAVSAVVFNGNEDKIYIYVLSDNEPFLVSGNRETATEIIKKIEEASKND